MSGAADALVVSTLESRRYFPHLLIFSFSVLVIVYWLVHGIFSIVVASLSEEIAQRDVHVDLRTFKSRKHHTGTRKKGSRRHRRLSSGIRQRKDTLLQALVLASNNDKNRRLEADAKALITRRTPSEELSGELSNDRLIGWMTLYWDIPTTITLPFMTLNVWPRSMRIPFHAAGSVFYLGADNFRSLRIFILWFSAFLLAVLQMLRHAAKGHLGPRWKTHRVVRIRAILSRIFYGAMYTAVIYQAGALLSDYRSCTPGFGPFNETACKHTIIHINASSNATSMQTLVDVNSVAFDIPTILCSFTIALWAFWGSLAYILHEKNSSSPAFMWMPFYEASRYTAKTFIAGAGSMFKTFPFVTMPTFLLGFSGLLYLTVGFQPCQGQGRRANNLRATGYALGVWFSLCGMISVVLKLDDADLSSDLIGIGWAVLVVGAITIARVTWLFNDVRSKKFAIPDLPWTSLLRLSNSRYVRRVIADAILQHAENTDGKVDVGSKLLMQMSQLVRSNVAAQSSTRRACDDFVNIRLSAAYLLFASTQRHRGNSRRNSFLTVEGDGVKNNSNRRSSLLLNFLTRKLAVHDGSSKRSLLHAISRRMLRWFDSNAYSMKNNEQRIRSKSHSGRMYRDKEGTFKQSDVDDLVQMVIEALLSPTVTAGLKLRVALSFVRTVEAQDEKSFFKVDENDPAIMNALSVAHVCLMVKTGFSEFKSSIKFLQMFSNRLKQSVLGYMTTSNEEEGAEDALRADPSSEDALVSYFLSPNGSQTKLEGVIDLTLKAISSWFSNCERPKKDATVASIVKRRVSSLVMPLKGNRAGKVVPLSYERTSYDKTEAMGVLVILSNLWDLEDSVDPSKAPELSDYWRPCLRIASIFVFSDDVLLHMSSMHFLKKVKNALNIPWEEMISADIAGAVKLLPSRLRLIRDHVTQYAKLVNNVAGMEEHFRVESALPNELDTQKQLPESKKRNLKKELVNILSLKDTDYLSNSQSRDFPQLFSNFAFHYCANALHVGIADPQIARYEISRVIKCWVATIAERVLLGNTNSSNMCEVPQVTMKKYVTNWHDRLQCVELHKMGKSTVSKNDIEWLFFDLCAPLVHDLPASLDCFLRMF